MYSLYSPARYFIEKCMSVLAVIFLNGVFCATLLSLSLTRWQQHSIWDTNELNMAFLGAAWSTGNGITGEKIPKTKQKVLTKQRAWMPGQDFYFWALTAKPAEVPVRQEIMSQLPAPQCAGSVRDALGPTAEQQPRQVGVREHRCGSHSAWCGSHSAWCGNCLLQRTSSTSVSWGTAVLPP